MEGRSSSQQKKASTQKRKGGKKQRAMDMGGLKNRLGRHMAKDLALIRYPAEGKAYFSLLASPPWTGAVDVNSMASSLQPH